MPGLAILKNRVAGHTPFVDLGEYLLKGLDVREYRFYRRISGCPEEFRAIFPRFYGVKHLIDAEKSIFEDVEMEGFDRIAEEHRQAKDNEMPDYFICIENLACGMQYPCSMDVKLGSHWSYVGVADTRGKSYDERWEKTTSAAVGLRYCGHIGFTSVSDSSLKMSPHVTLSEVPNSSPKMYRVFQNKDVGWELKTEDLGDTISKFFCYPLLQLRPELVRETIKGIRAIIKPLEEQHVFTFRSTSLLVIYDAVGSTVKMSLIDFSHEFEISPEKADEKKGLVPGDTDIVRSLKNFIDLLEDRLKVLGNP